MKVGDLVRMKFEHSDRWHLSCFRSANTYSIVYEVHHKAIKVILPDNTITTSLMSHWDIISSA